MRCFWVIVAVSLCVRAAAQAPSAGPPPTTDAWIGEGDGPPGVRLAQSTEAVSRPAVVEEPPPAGPPQRGLLQGIEFSADWAPRFEEDSLGRSTLSASVSLGAPPLVLGLPLLVTPRAAIHLLDGPAGIDAPDSVNDFEVSFGTFKKLSERWAARAAVTVGVYADDYSLDDADALRVSGLGLAIYTHSPEWVWVFGAAYLNRDDISVIPAVGVIHARGDVRYELTMPRPRVAWRLGQDATGRDRSVYVAGELGGGAWAVRRQDGTTDTLNLSRWGVMLGYETSAAATLGLWSAGGWKTRYEIGYLFGQDLEYADGGEELSLDDSLIVRAGWSY